MSFAKTNGLAGVMVWELDQDVQPGDTFANGVALPWNTTSIVAGLAAMQ
jgi:GH18 family chitinase